MQIVAMALAAALFFGMGCFAAFAAVFTIYATSAFCRIEWLGALIYGPASAFCFFIAWALNPFTLTVQP